jgi:hypothetical protein
LNAEEKEKQQSYKITVGLKPTRPHAWRILDVYFNYSNTRADKPKLLKLCGIED